MACGAGLAPVGDTALKQRDQFIRLILDTRKRLETLYTQPLAGTPCAGPKRAIRTVAQRIPHLRDSQWGGDKR